MAIPRVNVVGTVLDPTGNPAQGGRISIRLSSPGAVADDVSGDGASIGGETVVPIADDGTVDFYLVPTAEITPAGTHYRARFETRAGYRWTKRWQPGATDPVNIGDLPEV